MNVKPIDMWPGLSAMCEHCGGLIVVELATTTSGAEFMTWLHAKTQRLMCDLPETLATATPTGSSYEWVV